MPTPQPFPFLPEAWFFDLDGTLIDTIEDISISLNKVFLRNGLPALSQEVIKKAIGNGLISLFEECVPAPTPRSLFERWVMEFEEDYFANISVHSKPYAGVPEFLSSIHHQYHPIMVLLSNKPQKPCEKLLANLGLSEFFTVVWGGDQSPKPKPHPHGYLEICKNFQVNPSKTLYFGDGWQDAAVCEAVQSTFYCKTQGYGDLIALEKYRPYSFFSNWEELLPFLSH